MRRRGGTAGKCVRYRPGGRQARDREHDARMRRRHLQRDIDRRARRRIAASHCGRRSRWRWRARRHRRAQSPGRSAARALPGRSDEPRSRCRSPRAARSRTGRHLDDRRACRCRPAQASRSWPIISFIRVPSASMRLRCFSASGPAFRRASSTATCNRASGDRSSCEMSESSCFCVETSRCSRSAIASKSRTRSPISSRRGRTMSPARAPRSPAASRPLASRTRLSGDARWRARRKHTTADTTTAATRTGVGMNTGDGLWRWQAGDDSIEAA